MKVLGRELLILLKLLCYAALATATPASAYPEKATPQDRAVILSCLKTLEQSGQPGPEACLFKVADPCLEQPDSVSTLGMATCFVRETLVWDALLNDAYRSVQANLETRKQKDELRDVQRAWIKSRDANCAFYRTYAQGGTIAGPQGAACRTRQTANQAIYLRKFLHGPAGPQQ